MKVFKVAEMFSAYQFKSTEYGDNFEQLQTEVAQDGGIATRNGKRVNISFGDAQREIFIDSCLVLENGIWRLMSLENFSRLYTTYDVNAHVANLSTKVQLLENKIESILELVNKKLSTTEAGLYEAPAYTPDDSPKTTSKRKKGNESKGA